MSQYYDIVARSQQNTTRDYTPGETFAIYGSTMRPMSASWARIPDAVYVNTDFAEKTKTGVHTWVVVPYELGRATIESYELKTFANMKGIIWQPEKTLVRFAIDLNVSDKYAAIVATPDGVRHVTDGCETVQDTLDDIARLYGHNTINTSLERVQEYLDNCGEYDESILLSIEPIEA